eukprot:CAMPEP_0173436890 /NCGR_PEP_ID=MMETSP1357-20121228/17522_1 /TAXON_ID=77926 /ORGANISM="Hemiselmis rufescens, Strain PCC563" /LENGTH=138 /DNA_ID=CAMNT_0014402041 /DNA_START=65 /DNA_END=478 /DNA_ORIENTATION=+
MRAGARLSSLLLLCMAAATHSLVVPLPASNPSHSLRSISLERATDGQKVDLGPSLASTTGKTLLILGSYPADFNTIEYAQKVAASWPELQEKGVDRCMMVINGPPPSCTKLASLLSLPPSIELLSDPTGEAGRAFGVS